MAKVPELQRIAARTAITSEPPVHFTWRLEGITAAFFTEAASGKEATGLLSPVFKALGNKWSLQLFPNGDCEGSEKHVSVFLVLREGAGCKLHATLSIGRKSSRAFSTDFTTGGTVASWGYNTFLTHEALLAASWTYFPGGVMTVTAELASIQFAVGEEVGAEAEVSAPPLPPSTIVGDFARLLESEDGADVTLCCGGARLAAHSAVLCARSSVFRAQLRGPMAVKRRDAVPVLSEEITPDTLRRTLLFIYTDELEPTSAEEAQHLLNAAEVYCLPRLRAICERTLTSALSIENVAFTLTLAEQHDAAGLKDAALRFAAKHITEVLKTDGWLHLGQSSQPLVNAVMHTLATGAPPPAAAAAAAAAAEAGGAGGEDEEGRRVRRRTRAQQ